MTIDHINAIVFNREYFMLTVIGRVSFVLFAYILAYNFCFHTHSRVRYVIRLVLFGVISQPFFVFGFMTNQWNIFVTLALGAGLLLLTRVRWGDVTIVALLSSMWIFSLRYGELLPMINYGVAGILMVVMFGLYLQERHWLWLSWLMVVIAGLNVVSSASDTLMYGLSALTALLIAHWSGQSSMSFAWMRRSRWFFYLYYPLHIVLLRVFVIYFMASH